MPDSTPKITCPAATDNPASVAYECAEYRAMADLAVLPDDLMGGTEAMRKAGEKWTPKAQFEEDDSYQRRLSRSILFNAYKDTLSKTVGKPFSHPVTLQNADKLDEELEMIEEDADGCGKNLTQFAAEVLKEAVHRGLTHVLVEAPTVTVDPDKPFTKKDVAEKQLHPYFAHISPNALIGWRIEDEHDGEPVLMQIRVKETAKVPDGPYGEKVVDRIRVYNAPGYGVLPGFDDTKEQVDGGSWELWQKTEDGQQYELIQDGPFDYTGPGLPLVTLYISQSGCMAGRPALEELAWLNLEHWQSKSDQRNILHVARCPILHLHKVSERVNPITGTVEKVKIGPGHAIESEKDGADVSWCEITGNSIESGRDDLKDIEERMQIFGAQPFAQRRQDQTATGKGIDQANTDCDAKRWVTDEEGVFLRLYELAAEFVRKTLPDEFGVAIYKDFAALPSHGTTLAQVEKMYDAGVITAQTYVEEGRRRGTLAESVDPAAEVEAAKDEAAERMKDMPGFDDEPETEQSEAA